MCVCVSCVCDCVCTTVHIYLFILHFKLRSSGWVSTLPYGAIYLCFLMVNFFTVPGAAYWLANKYWGAVCLGELPELGLQMCVPINGFHLGA